MQREDPAATIAFLGFSRRSSSGGEVGGDEDEGFRSIENKKFPTMTNKNKPRSDLRDAKTTSERD
jgi:hypothetical protein